MTNKDRKKIAEAYVRLHSDQNMTYTSENGYPEMLNSKRDCDNCIHHTENGCSSWNCAFEPKEGETE